MPPSLSSASSPQRLSPSSNCQTYLPTTHPPPQKAPPSGLKGNTKAYSSGSGLEFRSLPREEGGGVEVCGIKLRRKREGGNERDVGLIRFPSLPVNSFWAISAMRWVWNIPSPNGTDCKTHPGARPFCLTRRRTTWPGHGMGVYDL